MSRFHLEFDDGVTITLRKQDDGDLALDAGYGGEIYLSPHNASFLATAILTILQPSSDERERVPAISPVPSLSTDDDVQF